MYELIKRIDFGFDGKLFLEICFFYDFIVIEGYVGCVLSFIVFWFFRVLVSVLVVFVVLNLLYMSYDSRDNKLVVFLGYRMDSGR